MDYLTDSSFVHFGVYSTLNGRNHEGDQWDHAMVELPGAKFRSLCRP